MLTIKNIPNVTVSRNVFSGAGLNVINAQTAHLEHNDFYNPPAPAMSVDAAEIFARNNRIFDDYSNGGAFSAERRASTGWQKLGPALPAHCPNCGTIFASRHYNIHSPRFNGIDNEETCPVCKQGQAKVSDGIFNLARDVIEVISAPEFSLQMLSNCASVAYELHQGNIGLRQAAFAYSQISPKLGELLNRALKLGNSATGWLTLLMGLIALYEQMSQGPLLEDLLATQKQALVEQRELRSIAQNSLIEQRAQTGIQRDKLLEDRKQTAIAVKRLTEERMQTDIMREELELLRRKAIEDERRNERDEVRENRVEAKAHEALIYLDKVIICLPREDAERVTAEVQKALPAPKKTSNSKKRKERQQKRREFKGSKS